MSLDAVKILEISITKNSKNEILEFIRKSLKHRAIKSEKNKKNASFTKKFLTIVTPNPEQIVFARHNSHFQQLLNQADVSLPDGIGIVWASKLLSVFRVPSPDLRVPKVIPGIEFMEDLISEAVKQPVGIALIGGRNGLALKTFDCLSKTHPGLQGWSVDGPEVRFTNHDLRFTSENPEKYFLDLANKIITTGVRIVFVGLGAPKQEYFIERLSQIVNRNPRFEKQKNITSPESRIPSPVVFMSVGGSFDEIAGRVARAPEWVSWVGLKWLWRLILEPWRIRRQLALLKFICLVISERYRLK
jgi:N-acetylglucosaminyldiphosphoundecaprenol N-acetyl-beta-D-mannosaminyltransferase